MNIPYRETTYTWKYSAAITVDASAWVAGAAEVSIPIPTDWDAFWLTINQTDARDVRILDADGLTKLTYDIVKTGPAAIDATAITNRDGRIRISGWTPPAAAMCRLVIIWGNSTVATGAGVPTFAAPLNGYIAVTAPARGWRARGVERGRTKPAATITKGAAEVLTVGVEVSPLLNSRTASSANTRAKEAISYASYSVTLAGAAQAAMITASSLRFLDTSRMYFDVKAGTTAVSYTIVPVVVTTAAQTLSPRALLDVRDLSE